MARPTVLIVEDNVLVARDLEARLHSLGYPVVGIAGTGADAVRLAVETRPDLTLMDVVLPGGMDGVAAAAEIRRRTASSVIYLTGYADLTTIERARTTEPAGFLVKPFSEPELVANLETAGYRHLMRDRLRRVERWLAAATDESIDASVAAGPDGTVNAVSPAAAAMTGWDIDAAAGRRLCEVVRLVHRATGRPIPLDDLAEGPVVGLAADTLLLDRRGTGHPVDVTVSCARGPDDRPARLVAVFREPNPLRAEALAALVADVAFATTQAVTLPGMLQLCAEALARRLPAALVRVWTLNTNEDTLIHQASAAPEPRPPNPPPAVPLGESGLGRLVRDRRAVLVDAAPTDPAVVDPAWARRERVLAFAAYPLLVDGRPVGAMAVCTRRPIAQGPLGTLRPAVNAIAVGVERKRLEAQLRQSQKMETVGRLAGGVAHDFNNLLTVIAGYSDLIRPHLPAGSPALDLVDEIAQAGTRAAGLTRQLLAFSRQQAIEPRVVELNTLIVDLEPLLRRLARVDVALALRLAPDLGRVKADPAQLEQVLFNLAANARDAMPSGGRLTIESANVELAADAPDAHPLAPPGRYVRMTVTDTGVGMDPATKAHLFEPFFTTKEPGKGTGLGLATVWGVVRQAGGHVAVDSAPTRGAQFRVYLPRTDEPVVPTHMPTTTRVPAGTQTILLAEDDDAVRALTHHVLRKEGYKVLEAGHGAEALRLAEEHGGPIHLLVTDVIMPGMSGRQLADRLAAERPGLKVLYLSGYVDEAITRHGIDAGKTALLTKPFSPAALARKVAEVLEA
jgi:signal transduction histidine kinase/DNA-binding response OmpR family regulator